MPRILDRGGLTHGMDESTDTTRPHTCLKCGTTRGHDAVPYLVVLHRAIAGKIVRSLRRPCRALDSGRCAQGRFGWSRRDCEANTRTYVSVKEASIDADASAPLSQLRYVGECWRVA
jgi:hypothetical protein